MIHRRTERRSNRQLDVAFFLFHQRQVESRTKSRDEILSFCESTRPSTSTLQSPQGGKKFLLNEIYKPFRVRLVLTRNPAIGAPRGSRVECTPFGMWPRLKARREGEGPSVMLGRACPVVAPGYFGPRSTPRTLPASPPSFSAPFVFCAPRETSGDREDDGPARVCVRPGASDGDKECRGPRAIERDEQNSNRFPSSGRCSFSRDGYPRASSSSPDFVSPPSLPTSNLLLVPLRLLSVFVLVRSRLLVSVVLRKSSKSTRGLAEKRTIRADIQESEFPAWQLGACPRLAKEEGRGGKTLARKCQARR